MATWERRTLAVNGVETVLLTAGSGPPLVVFHGAGTVSRFDFAAPWTREFRVIVPYHPGFGESPDDPRFTEIHDYVLHYLELFAALNLARVRLVGHSLGGYIAAKLGIEHGQLIEKLVLISPIGLPIDDPATVDFLKVPPEQLPALLAYDPQTVVKHLPSGPPSEAFIAERTKETQTAGRLVGDGRTFDPKLPYYLHRLTMPTLIVWGQEDRLTPAGQAPHWSRALPKAELKVYPQAGHLVLDEAPAAVEDIARFLR